jgi:hypothetical protein
VRKRASERASERERERERERDRERERPTPTPTPTSSSKDLTRKPIYHRRTVDHDHTRKTRGKERFGDQKEDDTRVHEEEDTCVSKGKS